MNKVYSRTNWENEPSTKTPLNEHNLNKIDFAVDEIDNRVIELDATKAKNTDLQTLSTRVDNLILNAGDSSVEAADARVTEDGTVYDTLKNRLDAEHSNVTSDISQLSNETGWAIDSLYSHILQNIINHTPNYIRDKYMSQGEERDVEDWICDANFIEIEPLTEYTFFGVADGGLILSFFDENKTYIEHGDLIGTGEKFTFVTPTYAAYMRYSVYYTLKNCQLVKGNGTYLWDKENTESFRVFEHVIANSDTKQYLPNLNDALDNTIYRIQLIDGTTLDNMPSDYPYSDMDVYFVITITNKYSHYDKNYIPKMQYIIKADFAKIYHRDYYESWSEWRLDIDNTTDNTNVKKVITCGEGKEYTTLRSAIARGCELGCEVVVYPGTYDLKDEFPNVQVNHDAYGIALYGGVYVKFLPGSYVKAIFDNTDRWIYDNFQPFYSTGDFTLEGLNIECANTRYCVHDEHSGKGTYKHVYKDCVMKYTNEHEDINYAQCIGGGLGEHGYIEIDGGYYESKTTVPVPTLTLEESQMPITYHNGYSQNCDGKIVIKNVYLADKGYFRFGMYGSSQIKTKIYISGCSMHKPIWNMYENSDYTVENFEIIEFNNEVRNAE